MVYTHFSQHNNVALQQCIFAPSVQSAQVYWPACGKGLREKFTDRRTGHDHYTCSSRAKNVK